MLSELIGTWPYEICSNLEFLYWDFAVLFSRDDDDDDEKVGRKKEKKEDLKNVPSITNFFQSSRSNASASVGARIDCPSFFNGTLSLANHAIVRLNQNLANHGIVRLNQNLANHGIVRLNRNLANHGTVRLNHESSLNSFLPEIYSTVHSVVPYTTLVWTELNVGAFRCLKVITSRLHPIATFLPPYCWIHTPHPHVFTVVHLCSIMFTYVLPVFACVC